MVIDGEWVRQMFLDRHEAILHALACQAGAEHTEAQSAAFYAARVLGFPESK